MKNFPIEKVYRHIEPGPVLLVTTHHKGVSNVMTIGFHMMIQHDPPLIGAIIGPWDHSYTALRKTRECVLAIPTVDLMAKVVDIGNCSGADVDKFEKFNLTPKPGHSVKAPLIKECLFNIECKVADTRMVKAYNLFILEATKAWTDVARKEKRIFHHRGDGTFTVDGKVMDMQKRMVKWKMFQD